MESRDLKTPDRLGPGSIHVPVTDRNSPRWTMSETLTFARQGGADRCSLEGLPLPPVKVQRPAPPLSGAARGSVESDGAHLDLRPAPSPEAGCIVLRAELAALEMRPIVRPVGQPSRGLHVVVRGLRAVKQPLERM